MATKKSTKKSKEAFSYAKASEAARAKIKAKREANAVNRVEAKLPPIPANEILDTTRIEGKQLSTWIKEIEKYEDKCAKSMKPGKVLVLDLTVFPGWVLWAIEQWKKNGFPTKGDKLSEEANIMLEKAKDLEKFAAMDRKKGTQAGMEANEKGQGAKHKAKLEKLRDKKLEQASRKEADAKDLREQANKILAKLEA